LLKTKTVLDTKESYVHIDDLQEAKPGFETHGVED
jgi:hypothetical protein